jgi:hypothetical protein
MRSVEKVAHGERGTTEHPDGSNNGAMVREYMACTWLAVPKPGQTGWFWCVAFWQWVIKHAFGKAFPYRTAANFQLRAYAKQHKLTTTKPELWDAAILTGDRHITFLEKRLSSTRFSGFGGNQSNSVRSSTYSYSDVICWVSSDKVRRHIVPANDKQVWEVVVNEDGQAKVVFTGTSTTKVQEAVGKQMKAGKNVVVKKQKGE